MRTTPQHERTYTPVASDPPIKTWIFQANPTKYRIEDSLRLEQSEYWNLNQHAKHVRAGDRVLVWISGADAGIYAIGTVLTEPQMMPDSPRGQGYWANEKDGARAKPRVLVEYHTSILERPLLKRYLELDPALEKLSVIKQPRGTNFKVTDREWRALEEWLRDGGVLEEELQDHEASGPA